MKKSILFTALVAMLVATSCAGSDSTSEETATPAKKKAPERECWYSAPLYGDVECVTITDYDVADKFGEIVKDKITGKTFYRFNQKGDVIEWARYNSDGSLEWKNLYKYDSQGNQIEEAEYNSDGSLMSKWLYKYDSQGNLIEETSYDSDGSLDWKYISKYDSQGNLIELAEYKGEIMKPTEIDVREIVYRK